MNHKESFRLASFLLLDLNRDDAIREVLTSGGRILLVFVLAFIASRLVERVVEPLVRVAVREQMAGKPELEVVKRAATLTGVMINTVGVAIAIVAIITVMPEFGINPGPLIAGLGLVGLAVGFGAQNIVKDVINGTELLLENQYGRGDTVRLRTTTGGLISGVVEDVNLRRTVLRDNDGTVHFISHGSIEVSSNSTRLYSRVLLHLGIRAPATAAQAIGIIDRVGVEMHADPAFDKIIREPPRVSGLERLSQDAFEVRILGVTEPGDQWQVAAELRLRLKAAFESEGIQIYDIVAS